MEKTIVNIKGEDVEVDVADIISMTVFAATTYDVVLADGRSGRITDAALLEKLERSNTGHA